MFCCMFDVFIQTTVSGTLVGNPGISAVDIDSGDTLYFSMNCGDDSKYFYLSTADNMVSNLVYVLSV